MMHSRLSVSLAVGAVMFAAMLGPSPADARNPCVREAKRDYKDCTAGCKEGFQVAKDACLNRDHACVEVCRANRAQCRLDTGFDAAIDGCNESLEAGRQKCVDDYPAGDDRDRCIDDAQVDAFECRDGARETAKPLLKLCRGAFRACARACPVRDTADPADPPVDKTQCLVDAKNTYLFCQGKCREAFQIGKDDCRNRDHACVEQCREERYVCLQPVRAQLALDLAACGTRRDAGIADCTAQYPLPMDEEAEGAFDRCVDGVQVAAFICRDDAREVATPGFLGCRGQFRGCVQTNCPPLS